MELDQFRDVDLVIDYANYTFMEKQFVSQGDYKGRTLTVQVTDNGVVGEVPGLILNLNWHNQASGLTDLSAFSILDKSNSVYRIEYPRHMMTPGKVIASIQVIQNGKVTNLKQFELTVQELAGQTVGIVQKAEFSALVAVLADSNKFRTDIDKKASKEELDNQRVSLEKSIAEMGVGLGGAVDSLAQLQSLYPSGTEGFWITQDDGHFYIWKNGAWSDMGIFQEAKLGIGSVDLEQTNFSKIVSKNLFNKTTAVIGALNSTGAVVSNTNFITSAYVEVKPSDVIKTTHNMQSYAFYNADKAFISGLQNAGVSTVTAPSDARFVRVSFYYTNISAFMIAIGSLPNTYEEFKREIKNDAIPVIDREKIANGAVSKDQTDFLEVGKNKADPNKKVIGKYIDPDNGNEVSNSAYNVFKDIPKGDMSSVTVTGCRFISFRDMNGNILPDIGIKQPGNPAPFTFPLTDSRIATFSVSYLATKDDQFQIEEGESQTSYLPFGYVIRNLAVPQSAVYKDDFDKLQILNIPKKLYLTNNADFTIYERNISIADSKYMFIGSKGKAVQGGYLLNQNSSGSFNLEVQQYEEGTLASKRTTQCISSPLRSTESKMLLLGDSVTRAYNNGNVGVLIDFIKSLLGDRADSVGTMISASGNRFEGRGGWTAAKYRTNASYEGIVNPFYNPTINDFDFSYYLSENSIDVPDVVIINLGTNDTFSYKTDADLVAAFTNILSNLDFIISSIRSVNSATKIGLHLTIPPTENINQWGASYNNDAGNYQAQWRYKRNNFLWVNKLLDYYKNSNVDLIGTNLVLDPEKDISDGVHPTLEGYKKIAQTDVNYINSI